MEEELEPISEETVIACAEAFENCPSRNVLECLRASLEEFQRRQKAQAIAYN